MTSSRSCDLNNLTRNDVIGLDERSNESCEGIEASKEIIVALLDREAQSVSV